ncbi:hypothetical protein D4R30_00875 [archaeon]|nr:MAG: hypothetical protein D4R30_00875 [archaeon]
MKSVAIIGTRQPDTLQYQYAEELAEHLSHTFGVTIVTGGAYGIDQAAMAGALKPLLEVYLPWSTYNEHLVPADAGKIVVTNPTVHRQWFESVNRYHPNPAAVTTRGVRALHARNFGIVTGRDLVIAFPSDTGGGGTGQGIRIAEGESVPVLSFVRHGRLPAFVTVLHDVLTRLGLN